MGKFADAEKRNKLIMLGYKPMIESDMAFVACTEKRMFISTCSGQELTMDFDGAKVENLGYFITITVYNNIGDIIEKIHTDSFGNIIRLPSKDSDGNNMYNITAKGYFYENEEHWVAKDLHNNIVYYNKKLKRKADINLGKHAISCPNSLAVNTLNGIAPMCILLGNKMAGRWLYINFNEKLVVPLIGVLHHHEDYTEVRRYNFDSEFEMLKWIDHKSGLAYRTTREPEVFEDETIKLCGSNMATQKYTSKEYKY